MFPAGGVGTGRQRGGYPLRSFNKEIVMALHFDYSTCEGRDDWTDADYELLDVFIWGTIGVDLGAIREDNLSEWLYRIYLWDLATDCFTLRWVNEDGKRESRLVGIDDLRKFVGLKTNASTKKRAEWMKRVMKVLADKANAHAKYYLDQVGSC